MKLLFVVLDAGLGGHTRSSIAIAKSLRERGHEVVYYVGANADGTLLAEAGFHRETVANGRLGAYRAIATELPGVLAQHRIEAVHAFNTEGIDRVLAVCRARSVPFFLTICGGTAPRRLIALAPTIVFSEELKDQLERERGIPRHCLKVVASRVDLPAVERGAGSPGSALHDQFRAKYGISANARLIMRVARADAPYLESVIQGIEIAALLRRRGVEATFVHIGYEETERAPWVLGAIREKVAETNRSLGTTVAVTAQDESKRALQYVHMADVVLGSGRSAFEAMTLRKPTLVVGPNGYAGSVSRECIGPLAHFNFSGRNTVEPLARDRSVGAAAAEIARILEDRARAAELGEFGRRYVEQNLDVGMAAEKYEDLYRSFRHQRYPDDRALRRLSVPLWRLLARRLISHNVRSIMLQKIATARRRLGGENAAAPTAE